MSDKNQMPAHILRAEHSALDRVLVAEDHGPTCEALRTLLEKKGFEVTAVGDGREAIGRLLSPDGPSIGIIDWMMPEANGLEVCRAVRAAVPTRHVYLIMATARDREEDVAEALAAGADDFVRKPCGPTELIARVRSGRRTIGLECHLAGLVAARTAELQTAVTALETQISEGQRLRAEVLRMSEEERLRVAADLHDGICQELAGIRLFAHTLRDQLEKAGHPLAAEARRIEEAIVGTTDHTRQVARGLNPVVADGGGLMHALRHLADTTARSHRMHCSFHCAAPVPIDDPKLANELYRIAQEAIYNAIRHGEAKRITVRLSASGGDGCLAVRDNGGGLPADHARAPGMGLRVMRYRAGLIGGQLVVQPRRGGGTEVICRFSQSTDRH